VNGAKHMSEKKENTNIGIAALVLGSIGIILVFLPWIGLPFRSDIVAIPCAILAVVFGYFARKQDDSYGRMGLILGVIRNNSNNYHSYYNIHNSHLC
jgi:hypothetical protein